MKRYLITCCLFFALANQGLAQNNALVLEAGVSLGSMNSLTDLGGRKGIGQTFIKDLNIGFTHFAGGMYAGVIYDNKYALRVEATMSKISGHDSVLKRVKGPDISLARYNRNLGVRSNIQEIALIGELHLLYIIKDLFDDYDPPRFSPYLLAGVGYFKFKPQSNIGDKWIDLKPLSTEGQGFKEYPDRLPYKLEQMNLPVGGGIKFDYSDRLTIRGEFILRKLFTDYLDDLSTTYINPAVFANYLSGENLANALILNDRQLVPVTNPLGGSKRGTMTQNDSYFTFNLKVGISIGKQAGSSMSRNQKNQLKCPKFF